MSDGLGPVAGDVIIRGTLGEGFAVIDAMTQHAISGIALSLESAIEVALNHARRGTIWQQLTDARGRPFGPPQQLLPRSA